MYSLEDIGDGVKSWGWESLEWNLREKLQGKVIIICWNFNGEV